MHRDARNTRWFTHGKGSAVENQDKQANEQQPAEERDEMEDLDVSQQKAEDVKGGARARRGRWSKEP